MRVPSSLFSCYQASVLCRRRIEDRSAWYGAGATDNTDWIKQISTDQIGEVENAVQELERSGIEIEKITAEEVPLPALASRLKRILDEVLNGRGFVLIKSTAGRALDQAAGGDCVSDDWRAARESADAECRGTLARACEGSWDVRATIRIRGFIRRVNGKRFTLTRAMLLG